MDIEIDSSSQPSLDTSDGENESDEIGDDDGSGDFEVQAIPHFGILRLYIMFLFLWQTLFRLSDTGITVLFSFFATFLVLVATRVGNDQMLCSCKSLYAFDDCKKRGVNGQLISKQCGFVRYSAHVQQQRRQPCGQLLLRPLKKSSVSFALQPKAIFCYNSLISSLSKLVRRADFFEKSEAWRSRPKNTAGNSDIYDGKLWNEFQVLSGQPFLAVPYNFCLTLNIDWFQPLRRPPTH